MDNDVKNGACLDERALFQDCTRLWGVEAQIHMLIEECAELIRAACHYGFRDLYEPSQYSNFIEELADVEIMCAQMRLYVGDKIVDEEKEIKLGRLLQRVAKECKKHQEGGTERVGENE